MQVHGRHTVGGQIVRGNLISKVHLAVLTEPKSSERASGNPERKGWVNFPCIEFFFNDAPNIITYVGKIINIYFYDRTIFTNVSG